jgi:uncharacterized protein (TIGR02145 family)
LISGCTRTGKNDKTSYKSVIIGTQEWMTENLDVDRFSNGELIVETKENVDWQRMRDEKKPTWCYYLNRKEYEEGYGKLYNWYAVSDPRGLCPKGWHVPTQQEWLTLEKFLGDSAGSKLKSTSGWNLSPGNNSSGFNALASEDRWNDGKFGESNGYAVFWTTTSHKENVAISLMIIAHKVEITNPNFSNKGSGLSCRCIKVWIHMNGSS